MKNQGYGDLFLGGLLCVIGFQSNPAEAVRLALEPQNRIFVGASQTDGAIGVTTSIESRLTQLIYINMGGFVTTPKNMGDVESRDPQDWVQLNHGLWAAPGWRMPHRYKEGPLNWDVVARGGFACVFTTDAFRDDLYLIDPAGILGGDAYLQYKISENRTVGMRWSHKWFLYQPDLTKTKKGLPVQRLQNNLEFYWQF